jgi:hypothetical protein
VCVGVLYAVNRSYVDPASVRLWVVTLVSSIEEPVRISCKFVQELLTWSCRASMRCLKIVDRCTLLKGVQDCHRPSWIFGPIGANIGVGYLDSITGVSPWLRVSTLDVRYLRLRVSTLDVRYLQSITGVYTRCPVSPLDYGCLQSMSGISTRLRVSILDVRYLQSITGVYTRCPVSPLDYGCLQSMSRISTRLQVSTLDVRYLQSITGACTRPVSPFA